jgi:vesicular inhibitory amino acid transporter
VLINFLRSKFGLNTQPVSFIIHDNFQYVETLQQLNATIEILLGLDSPLTSPEDLAAKPDGLSVAPKGSHFGRWKRLLSVVQRILVTTLSITVSIMIPEFSSMMAFVGSFSAFMISIVGPVVAKAMIDKKCGLFDSCIIIVGTVMAVWGTVAAFK